MKLLSVTTNYRPVTVSPEYVWKNAGTYRATSVKNPRFVYISDGKGNVSFGTLGNHRTPCDCGPSSYSGCRFTVVALDAPPTTPKTPTKYQKAKEALTEWMKGYATGKLQSAVVRNLACTIEWGQDGERFVYDDEKRLYEAIKALGFGTRDYARFMAHAAREGKKIGK